MNLASFSNVPQRKNIWVGYFYFFSTSESSKFRGSKYHSIVLINRGRRRDCSTSSINLITAFGIYYLIFTSIKNHK